jgi:hypothetical protein
MSKRESDTSPGHLEWLVKWRSENQRASLELYCLLKKHATEIRTDPQLILVSQALIGVAFSLWRAVFLSDKEGTLDIALTDAEEFLGKLILDNAINYTQDRTAREWTFNYYLHNAYTRLLTVSNSKPSLLSAEQLNTRNLPMLPVKERPKYEWVHLQTVFSGAIEELKILLEGV